MRLWHKDLIPYLPRKQLVAQWRECCAICSNLANKGTPNHLLVNKIKNYNLYMFFEYIHLVIKEMENRGYKINENSYDKCFENFRKIITKYNWNFYSANEIYPEWHNERYLKQCLYNLQEKYDCGRISEKEWKIIEEHFDEYLD